jgi:hypothetical protein
MKLEEASELEKEMPAMMVVIKDMKPMKTHHKPSNKQQRTKCHLLIQSAQLSQGVWLWTLSHLFCGGRMKNH